LVVGGVTSDAASYYVVLRPVGHYWVMTLLATAHLRRVPPFVLPALNQHHLGATFALTVCAPQLPRAGEIAGQLRARLCGQVSVFGGDLGPVMQSGLQCGCASQSRALTHFRTGDTDHYGVVRLDDRRR
jgi:hypothetical protein